MTCSARAALAVLIGWGVWAGLARAGGTDAFPNTSPAATELPPGHPPIDSTPSKHPLWDRVFHHRPVGCWSSFNGYACTSFQAEMGFIFGSCRTFYSEPCLKGPPPSTLPPWAGPVSNYRRMVPSVGPDGAPLPYADPIGSGAPVPYGVPPQFRDQYQQNQQKPGCNCW